VKLGGPKAATLFARHTDPGEGNDGGRADGERSRHRELGLSACSIPERHEPLLETQRKRDERVLERARRSGRLSVVETRASEAPVAASSAAPEHPEAAVEIVAPPAPPAVDVAAPPLPAGRDKLEAQLLEIVSERTGYPQDMLGLDVDIEAELGIDSIKRVEILGTVQRTCLPDGALREDAMEQLNGIKTLRGIVVSKRRRPEPRAATPRRLAVPGAAPAGTEKGRAVGKRRLSSDPSSSIARSQGLLDGRPAAAPLVTEDSRGVARAVASSRRGRAVLLRPRQRAENGGRIDLTDPRRSICEDGARAKALSAVSSIFAGREARAPGLAGGGSALPSTSRVLLYARSSSATWGGVAGAARAVFASMPTR
jgi:hypothetical protein